MATITVFEAGHCTHRACMALRGAGLSTCAFPSRAYLIEVGGRRWLFDTGYAEHFLDHTRSGLFSLYAKVTPVCFEPRQAMVAQLLARGLRPSDLRAVILSHFHADHVAGLRDFPGRPVICSGAGWRITRKRTGIAALRRAYIPGLMPRDIDQRVQPMEGFERVALPARVAPFAQAWAVPGSARQLLLVDLPGHAAGHIGAFVQTDAGWTLLAADAAWSPSIYRELRGPSRLAGLVMEDVRAYDDTLRNLNAVYRAKGADIVLTHEGAL
jgi:glyoxylase-like metal-dependent hydrolase (beta-lactamase superfamily II)